MASTVPEGSDRRHRLLPDTAEHMAKADVRKADESWRVRVGKVVRTVRGELSLKEFAAAIARDERQVSRWEDGTERPHIDAIFAVAAFRESLVIAIARLADSVEIETVVRIRKSA